MILCGPILEPIPCPQCGTRCLTCGDRLCSTYGPEPVPRCPEHPCCTRDADQPVWCPECRAVLAAVAEDRAEQAAFDAGREAL